MAPDPKRQTDKMARDAARYGLLGDRRDIDPAQIERLADIFAGMSEEARRPVAQALEGLVDPERVAVATFCERHAITRSERALLLALLEGRTVVEHAGTRGIALSTARTQMRALLEKGEARGQLDLVRRVRALIPR